MTTINMTPVSTLRLKIVGMAFCFLSALPSAWAQQIAAHQKQEIVGIWKLVKDTNKGSDGVEKSLFGVHPIGQIVFVKEGHYSALLMRSDIPNFAAANRMQGTADENKAVVQGVIASFGRYSVSDDGKVLTMTPEGSTYPNWIGVASKRALTIVGDEMKFSVNASVGGVSELTYVRVK